MDRSPLATPSTAAVVAVAVLPWVLPSACTPGEDAASTGSPGADTLPAAPTPEQVAAGLLSPVQIRGEPPGVWTLEERMAHHRVPGVSVAVLDRGRIAWARGWGVADGETGAPVTPATLFQAASISKPVAALVALALVEEGVLGLDTPVNDHLTSWQVPGSELTADSVVTLRGLLSHTAGLTVWGFPGYRKDRPFRAGRDVASNVQVLDGLGNTDPVRVYRAPGIGWQYSGGGYTVMEQAVEDVTGRPFHEVARERVLQPAGMARSTYLQPLPDVRWAEAARGHRGDGAEIEGEWHNYPEQAAAGLWTTPSELLALSIHLLEILDGRGTDGVLPREMLEAALTPHRAGEDGFEDYGLGFSVEGGGDDRSFGHGGSNAGFKAQWVVYPGRAQGAAVMTNGDRGSVLAAELLRSLAAAWDWPRFRPEVRPRRLLSAEEAAEYRGSYVLEGAEGGDAVVVTVRAGEGVLVLEVPEQGTYTLHAVPDASDEFFDASDGQTLVFERDEGGGVVALAVEGEARFVRTDGGGP